MRPKRQQQRVFQQYTPMSAVETSFASARKQTLRVTMLKVVVAPQAVILLSGALTG
jgi:hypothetical protein